MFRKNEEKEKEEKEELARKKMVVESFFEAWKIKFYESSRCFSKSVWSNPHKRNALDTVDPEDIIWHAFENPTDAKGNGGNRTAQVLFKDFGVIVKPLDLKAASLSRQANSSYISFPGNGKDNSEEKKGDAQDEAKKRNKICFLKALERVKIEKEIIEKFLTSGNERLSWGGLYWNGMRVNKLRLIDIIRYARTRADSSPVLIEEASIYAYSCSDLIDNERNKGKLSDKQNLIVEALKYIDKENELRDAFYGEHKKAQENDQISQCATSSRINHAKENLFIPGEKRSLADLFKCTRRFLFYSGNRSHAVFKEQGIDTRSSEHVDKTAEELAKKFVRQELTK